MGLSFLADTTEVVDWNQPWVEVEQQHMDWKVAAKPDEWTPDPEYSVQNWTAWIAVWVAVGVALHRNSWGEPAELLLCLAMYPLGEPAWREPFEEGGR